MTQHVDSWPFVSVVIPVRNEAGFIADLIGAILRQDYPADRLEVIVADGRSTDGTREILASLQAEQSRLIVVDNPGCIVSTGLNLAVARARGDVIVRIDGHALIAADFIQNHPIEPDKPLLNALWRLAGVAHPNGGVPLDIRLSFTDRTLVRRSLEKLLLWDFDKLIIAHGVCIGKDAKPFVERAFRWLRR